MYKGVIDRDIVMSLQRCLSVSNESSRCLINGNNLVSDCCSKLICWRRPRVAELRLEHTSKLDAREIRLFRTDNLHADGHLRVVTKTRRYRCRRQKARPAEGGPENMTLILRFGAVNVH